MPNYMRYQKNLYEVFTVSILSIFIAVLGVCSRVDSKRLEDGCRLVYADVPSFVGFGLGGRSCSNCFWFLLLSGG